MLKKLFIVLLCIILAAQFAACASPAADSYDATPSPAVAALEPESSGPYAAGTYTGIARGFGGEVEVTVVVDESGGLQVLAKGDGETQGIGSRAIEELPAAIQAAGSAEVDTIAGATISSEAVLQATQSALAKAAGAEPSAAALNMTPGTYEAEANGHSSMVTVAVTVDKTSIQSVQVTDDGETPHLSALPKERIPAAIVEQQSLNVDGVSGATFTSNAILEAATAALQQAGADVSVLTSRPRPEKSGSEDVALEYDVVIVGGGFAGLAAAATAGENGASVLVVEKMPVLGGNGVLCGGIYNAVDPVRQQAQGIEDSIELHIQNTYEGGDKIADLDLIRVLAEGAMDGLSWLEENGLELTGDVYQGFGALYPRTHLAVKPYGTGYYDALMSIIKGTGKVEFLMETKAEEFLMENGAVAGVRATGLADNKNYTIKARNGVVLSTGGFSANVEMRQKYNTSGKWATLDASVPTTNPPGPTGDGIIMAEAIGANLVDMEQIQLLPLASPRTGSTSNLINTRANDTNHICVNIHGERYVAEDERRDVLSAKLLEQPEAKCYIIVDSHYWTDESLTASGGTPLADLIERGDVVKGNTVEELAVNLGMDPAVLKATVDEFNAGVDAGTDRFGRTSYEYKLDQGPYYADLRVPGVHHTMGGVQINTDAQVLGTNGEAILGLYAAGEVTGGIHGTNRLGGNAIPDTIVFGRVAGNNASEYSRS